MAKEYITPEVDVIVMELDEVILSSLPTESGNQLPILTRKIVTNELNGDPDLDPIDQLIEPTEFL